MGAVHQWLRAILSAITSLACHTIAPTVLPAFVLASVTATLRDHVEILVLTGSDAINGYGSAQANRRGPPCHRRTTSGQTRMATAETPRLSRE